MCSLPAQILKEGQCHCLNFFCLETDRVKAAALNKHGIGMLRATRSCSSCSTAAYAPEVVSAVESNAAEFAEVLQSSSELSTYVTEALSATLGSGWTDVWTALTTVSTGPGSPSPSPGYSSSPSASPDYSPSPTFSSPDPSSG